jgi:1-deoxy-D-xylulose-5-phosphate synthase
VEEMSLLPIGKAEVKRQGNHLAILAFGSMVTSALAVGEKIDATVINMRFVKPLDEALILEMAKTHDCLVTVEENVIAGGAGSGVNEFLAREHTLLPILNLGLPDRFVEQGTREECLSACGLDEAGIFASIEAFIANQSVDQHHGRKRAGGKH